MPASDFAYDESLAWIPATVDALIERHPAIRAVSYLPLTDPLEVPSFAHVHDEDAAAIAALADSVSHSPLATVSIDLSGTSIVAPLDDDAGQVRAALLVLCVEPAPVAVRALVEVATIAVRQAARARREQYQRDLSDLVAKVAIRIMNVTTVNARQPALNEVMEILAEFLHADVAFLRRNDFDRELSVLEAEWPPRPWDGPGPDPLGEVPFAADPMFGALRDLRQPFFPGPESANEDYLARVADAGCPGVAVMGGAVPLLLHDVTWGALGFLHFNLHTWDPAEVTALQAIASMLVQMQARFAAEFNAYHDELTGLANRRALIRDLERRLGNDESVAVMVIDLDRFKVMNDHLGHATGDRLLVTMADRLRMSSRPTDLPARLGGDEFVLLLTVADEVEAHSAAQRLLELINQPTEMAGQVVRHTASIGVVLSWPGATALDLLGAADVAMYSSKSAGRNHVTSFDDELRAITDEQSRNELLLTHAIDNSELFLVYQPEFDLRTGEMLSVEALLRWNHPRRGTLAAAEFVPLAEESGLIPSLDRWVLDRACAQLAQWRAAGHRSLVMRVNMSPADFKLHDVVEYVEDTARRYAIPPDHLCLEVSEHVATSLSDIAPAALRRLRERGFLVTIDDFGAGFSSVTDLRRLPADYLKLATGFVAGLGGDPFDDLVAESIVRLASALGLGVIAEGLETARQRDALLALGCHRAQGYLLGRPQVAEIVTPMLAASLVG